MWALRRPSVTWLDDQLARVATVPLSYDEVGMTRQPEPPPGYGREHARVELAIDFAAAREAVASFATHRLPYLFVHPADARVVLGANVLVCARLGPVWSINPCRIVYLCDAPGRFTYAYGTLPGHAEAGEETFTVERTATGVMAETLAYARPQDVLARVGRPIAHRVQAKIKRDYMAALVGYAGAHGSPDAAST
ncbi:MAG TPA: DUF1990 domain-containing protein [Kofleriaceae bacterium]|nr:DUF1990 domain-containing protein [Kofleriaceae bacterium]